MGRATRRAYGWSLLQIRPLALEEVETSATTVTGGTEKILRRVEILRKALARQVEDLRDGLKNLRGS